MEHYQGSEWGVDEPVVWSPTALRFPRCDGVGVDGGASEEDTDEGCRVSSAPCSSREDRRASGVAESEEL